MISKMTENTIDIVALLANKLWEEADLNELKIHYNEILNSKDQVCFLIQQGETLMPLGTEEAETLAAESNPNEKFIGFIEVSTRYDYVEGCDHSPVAYIEGIYIDWEHRSRGLAKALVEAAVNWAKEQGYREMGSDCELTNEASIKFHTSSGIGFTEANRIVSFVRVL